MRIRAISLKWQLIAICVFLVTIPVMTLGTLSYQIFKREIYTSVEQKLQEQVLLISNHLKTAIDLTQERVNHDLKWAHEMLYSNGAPALDERQQMTLTVTHQITKEQHAVTIPILTFGGTPVADMMHASKLVDRIQAQVGVTSTIFQVIPDGLLRVSTNVLDEKGARAVDTYIPADSSIYQTIMRGKSYFGRAYVIKEWHQTAYEPITDAQGKIIGAFYVGVPEAPQKILENLAQIVIGNTGYVTILNTNGDYILSRKRERDGENILEARNASGRFFVREWIKKALTLRAGETCVDYYAWQNEEERQERLKIIAYTYFADWGWVIGSTSYIDDFMESVARIRVMTIIVSAAAILMGSGAAYLFAATIARHLARLMSSMEEVAQGNLTAAIQTTRRDEIGTLTVTLKQMVGKLREVVTHIKQGAKTVASGSQDIRSRAHDIAQGAQEQASASTQVFATMEQMETVTRRNAEHANQTGQLAVQVTADARESGQAVIEVLDSMRKITKEISSIREIARQTRMLSLNATIEAARAAESGKGFGVVAAEVRALAERSQGAAATITEVTENIVTLAESAGERLISLIPRIQETSDLIQEMSQANSRQQENIAQVNGALQQLDRVIQENALMGGALAEIAEELARQAHELQRVVEVFALPNDAADDGAAQTTTPPSA